MLSEVPLATLPGVESVIPILKPYRQVARDFRAEATIVTVGEGEGASIGGNALAVWVAGMPAGLGDARLPAWVRNEMKTVETEIKYAGYLEQQRKSMAKLKRDEERVIPAWFDYAACSGLSREMIEKLGKVRPRTLGQAIKIQGVTPAAVSLVNCFIEIQTKRMTA